MSIPINGYDREEHDGVANAKNVSIVKSLATIYAVVNTGAAGVGESLVTVLNPISIAGNVTIDSGSVAVTSAPTLYAVVNTGAATNPSNVTIDSGTLTAVTDITNPIAIKGNLTIDSGNIALTSAPTLYAVVNTGAATNPSNVTIDSGTITAVTDITNPVGIKAGAAYIGLATIDIGSAPTLTVDATGQGDVPITLGGEVVATTLSGNVTITDAKTYIGLVSTASITGRVSIAGNVTVNVGSLVGIRGNVTITSGTITAVTDITNPVALKGNITINSGTITAVTDITNPVGIKAGVAYIGLATVVQAAPTAVVNGMVSSASGGLVQFPANAVQWTTVRASNSNPTTCYVGSSTATINNGYFLDPGDTVGVAVNNTNTLYLVGVGTTEVRFIGG